MAVNTYKIKLVKKEKESTDAWKFFFEKPENFTYEAGQYIKLWMDLRKPDNRGKTRYFTLSSSPGEKYLIITTRILKSTFKLKLGSLKIGTTVKMRGPWGDFVLNPKEKMPLVFIAGGIGMTPYRSIIKYSTQEKVPINVHLFVSYRSPADILFTKELKDAEEINKKLKVITTITEDLDGWKGEKGRISTQLLQKYLKNLTQYTYYVSGPQPLVEAIKKMLLTTKIKAGQIKIDDFPGYE